MQKKDIAFVIIIQFLINKPKSTIGQIYNAFKIYPDGQGGYENRGEYPVCQRGIARYVNELIKMGIIQETEKLYSISDSKFVLKTLSEKKKLEDLINTLIEAKEKYILEPILDISDRQELNSNTIDSIMNRISSNIKSDDYINEELVYTIQKAIMNSNRIKVTYNSKEHEILPIAIVNNTSGTKKYLFYLYKGKLVEPFILSKITSVEVLDRTFIKNKKYLQDIYERWDIEGGKGQRVEILFHKSVIPQVIHKLKIRKNAEFDYDKEGNLLYTDNIRGLDDFKRWLRPYLKYCKINKPQFIRNDFLQKSIKKLQRYGEELDE